MKYIALTVMLLPVVAFSNDVDTHSALWGANGIKSYSYTLKRGGVFGYSLYKIKIRDGVCKAKAKHVFGRKPIVWSKDSCEGKTIEELFEAVKHQMEQGVNRVNIKFDQDYSFIANFVVEPKTEYTDQDWYFEIIGFQAKQMPDQ